MSVEEELWWVMHNSQGVVGLTLDGRPMDWAQVAALYMPSMVEFVRNRSASVLAADVLALNDLEEAP